MSAFNYCYFNRTGSCRNDASTCKFDHVSCRNGSQCVDSSCPRGHPAGWLPPKDDRNNVGVVRGVVTDVPMMLPSNNSFRRGEGPPPSAAAGQPRDQQVVPPPEGARAVVKDALSFQVFENAIECIEDSAPLQQQPLCETIKWEIYDLVESSWQELPSKKLSLALTNMFDTAAAAAGPVRLSWDTTEVIVVDFSQGIIDRANQHSHIRATQGGRILVNGKPRCARCTVMQYATRESAHAPLFVDWSFFDTKERIWIPFEDREGEDLEREFKTKVAQATMRVGSAFDGVVTQAVASFETFTMMRVGDRSKHIHIRRSKGGVIKKGEAESCIECRSPGAFIAPAAGAAMQQPRRQPISPALGQIPPQAERGRGRFDAAEATLKILSDLNNDIEGSPLLHRSWETISPPTPTPPAATEGPSFTFSLLQWNVLFSLFAKRSENTCPKVFLSYPHRLEVFSFYIESYQPDIVTLQEMESPGTPNFITFEKRMSDLGYTGMCARKARTGGDAVGIFYKKGAFTHLHENSSRVVFAEDPSASACASDAQVGLIVPLSHKATGKVVVIATTHLKADKLAEPARMEQMRILVERTWKTRRDIADGRQPIIITGDLNTSPRWELVTAVRTGQLSSVLGGIALRSAYQDDDAITRGFTDRDVTIYMPYTQDMLDYIFYDLNPKIKLTSLLRVPGERDIVRQSARDVPQPAPAFRQLPMPSFPSDHIPLVAQFTVY